LIYSKPNLSIVSELLTQSTKQRALSLRPVTAVEEKRMIEAFGAGTAAIVSPVKGFAFDGKEYEIPLDASDPKAKAGKLTARLADTIMGIQYGKIPHKWSWVVKP